MSTPLLDILRRRIAQDGPMPLDEYMALCLGHPEHGYYMTRDPFGAAGDFTTAPEISQLFGEMIGVWAADLWIKMGSPAEFALVECGPGRGTLMADLMRATKHVPGFHKAAKIHLMEMSPTLRNAQSVMLADFETQWIDDLGSINPRLPVILIGNEFLDALPIQQFEYKDGRWWERVVGLDEDNSLLLGLGEAFQMPENMPSDTPKEGAIFETSRHLNQYLKCMDNLLINQNGVALFLDYGHFHTNFGDSLQAMRSHQFTEVLDLPGESDLTAHVDFENVARLARVDNLYVHGPIEQGTFLMNLGIDMRAKMLLHRLTEDQKQSSAHPDGCRMVAELSDSSGGSRGVGGVFQGDAKMGQGLTQCDLILGGLNRLIDTTQMGSLFKAICLVSDPKIIPAGFHASL
ncbi:MAG: SAM-dependent methyltransferase [Micavibrio aeruginosavorus]|uniref:SAM-dependent methyltransferase n=1 Tax=Micavibrio aeruginosavorus TaxID=349221 RepID=A0A2W5PMV6_9BACT|nr:MAG: SAM-dependent methyltransferase [Micavibrio aeruginosavorus]